MDKNEEFERWAVSEGYKVDRVNGAYKYSLTHQAWGFWQARKPEIDALRDKCEELALSCSLAVCTAENLQKENAVLKAEVEKLRADAERPPPSRTEFERLIKAQTPTAQLTRAENGEYIVHVIQTMWKGYCMARPGSQEAEPVAWIAESGNLYGVEHAEAYDVSRFTPLYTRPANDKLRKAAEDVKQELFGMDFGDPKIKTCYRKLCAALEGKS